MYWYVEDERLDNEVCGWTGEICIWDVNFSRRYVNVLWSRTRQLLLITTCVATVSFLLTKHRERYKNNNLLLGFNQHRHGETSNSRLHFLRHQALPVWLSWLLSSFHQTSYYVYLLINSSCNITNLSKPSVLTKSFSMIWVELFDFQTYLWARKPIAVFKFVWNMVRRDLASNKC